MTEQRKRRRNASGLGGLDVVPPSAPSSHNATGQQEAVEPDPPHEPDQEREQEQEQEQEREPRTQTAHENRRLAPVPSSPQAMPIPQVEIPQNQRSNRTAQLNFRVTPDFRDWFGRQMKFVAAQTGLQDNQVSAIAVQVLGDSIEEIRYRSMLMAGLIEPDEDDDDQR